MTKREILDREFSIYIRKSKANYTGYLSCYTCGLRLHWKEAQCGHFIRRGNSVTRFNTINCKPQCRVCNEIKNGMPESFEENLREDYGDETIDNLVSSMVNLKSYTAVSFGVSF